MADLPACAKPCADCPWRRDAPIGHFPAEAFRRLAASAYDMNETLFQCHSTDDGRPLTCAGFLERGADHNLTVRMAYLRGNLDLRDRSGGQTLYDDFVEMAIANEVEPEDEALAPCRRNI